MDNLVSSVTKALTDFLEPYEKRFIAQQAAHEAQGRVLENLQAKIDGLEAKCQQLIGENHTLEEDIKKLKQHDDNTAEEIAHAKTDVEQLQNKLNRFEKIYVSQQTESEAQGKILQDLQTKTIDLEANCQQLMGENVTLKEDLKRVKKHDDDSVQEIVQAKSDIAKLQNGMHDFDKWANLVTVMADQVKILKEYKVNSEEKIEKILLNQTKISEQNRRLQQQWVSNSLKTPVRSPSTSYLNGNFQTHNSLPRSRSHKFQNNDNNFLQSLEEPSDDMSEIEADAERLRQHVETLNDIHRSFEKSSSIYSDE